MTGQPVDSVPARTKEVLGEVAGRIESGPRKGDYCNGVDMRGVLEIEVSQARMPTALSACSVAGYGTLRRRRRASAPAVVFGVGIASDSVTEVSRGSWAKDDLFVPRTNDREGRDAPLGATRDGISPPRASAAISETTAATMIGVDPVTW